MAKETGQRPPTPVVVKRDISDSEGEDEGEAEAKGDKPISKAKKKVSSFTSVAHVTRAHSSNRRKI